MKFFYLMLVCASGILFGKPVFYAGFDGNFSAAGEEGKPAGSTEFVQGKSGEAVTFKENSTLTYRIESHVHPQRGAIMFWVRPDGWNGADGFHHNFFYCRGSTDPNHWLAIYKTPTRDVVLIGGTVKSYTIAKVSVAHWNDGEWLLIAASWDSGRAELYVNGRKTAESVWPVIPVELGDTFRLGGGLWGACPGNTEIDEFRLYNRTLTGDEILEEYLLGTGKTKKEITQMRIEIKQLELQKEKLQKEHEERNIAKVLLGAKAIASDSKGHRNINTPDKAFDGDVSTAWESLEHAGPRWYEIFWMFPQQITDVICFVNEKPPFKNFTIEGFFPEEQKFRPVFSGVLNENNFFHAQFPAVTISKIRLNFNCTQMNPGEGLKIYSLRVLAAHPIPEKANWRSKWIWAPGKDGKYPDFAFVRKTMRIENPSEVVNVKIQALVDDDYVMYFNGDKTGSAGFREEKIFDVTSSIQKGENVIAAKLGNGGGALGFICEICINYRDGRSEIISSDNDWRASDVDTRGWQQIGFDDKDWKDAFVIANTPPDCPWGAVPYTDMSISSDEIYLEYEDFSAQLIKPGSWFSGSLNFSAKRKLLNRYSLRFKIEKERPAELRTDDYRIAEQVHPIEPATDTWKPGEKYKIPFRLWVPEFAPHDTVKFTIALQGNKKNPVLILSKSGKEESKNTLGEAHLGNIRISRFPKAIDNLEIYPEIKFSGSWPALFFNNTAVAPVVWQADFKNYEILHHYSKSGIHIYRIGPGNVISAGPDREKYMKRLCEVFDIQVRRILSMDPNAAIFVTMLVRTDAEWVKNNPEHTVVRGDGQKYPANSLDSMKWRNDGIQGITEIITHIENQDYAGRIFAYAFFAGGGGEFQPWGQNLGLEERSKAYYGDYCQGAMDSYKKFLISRYHNNLTALRAAWNDRSASFDTLPNSADFVKETEFGFFRDPLKEQKQIDYLDFRSDFNAENAIAFCRAVKNASRRKVKPLAGAFFGYFTTQVIQTAGGAQYRNYGAMSKVIDAPEVDIIALPHSYGHRNEGTPCGINSVWSSIQARKKLFLSEYDNRTFAAVGQYFAYDQKSLRESIEVTKRDIGAGLCTGSGWWWLDFSAGETGQTSIPWFIHPDLFEVKTRARPLFDIQLARGFTGVSEIAVITDFNSATYLDFYASIPTLNAVWLFGIDELYRVGAPFDLYHVNDLKLERLQKNYKLYIFLNTYHFTEAERALIQSKFQADGKTLLFLWAPGIIGEDGIQTAYAEKVTGMKLDVSTEWVSGGITLDEKAFKSMMGDAFTGFANLTVKEKPLSFAQKDWPISHFKNRAIYRKDISPVLYNRTSAEILGTFDANGKAGLSYHNGGSWHSYLCAIPFLPRDILRVIARKAGVHIYFESPDTSVYASGDFITLHNGLEKTEGTLHLRKKAPIQDAFSGKKIADAAATGVVLEPGETKVFLLKD